MKNNSPIKNNTAFPVRFCCQLSFKLVCSSLEKSAAESRARAGNQSVYDGVPVIDLFLDKMPSFSRHSTVGPLWEPSVNTVGHFRLQFLFYVSKLFKMIFKTMFYAMIWSKWLTLKLTAFFIKLLTYLQRTKTSLVTVPWFYTGECVLVANLR